MHEVAQLSAFVGIAFTAFLFLLIIQKKRKLQSDYLLLVWLVLMASHLTYLYFSFNSFFESNFIIQTIGSSLPVFHAPIVFLYTVSLSRGSLKPFHKILALSPLPFYLLIYGYVFGNKLILVDGLSRAYTSMTPDWVGYIGYSMIILNTVFIVKVIIEVRHQRSMLYGSFSDTNQLEIQWLNYWVLSFILGAVISTISILLFDFDLISIDSAFTLISMFMMLQLVVMGQYGIRQSNVFVDHDYYKQISNKDSKETAKYIKSGLKKSELKDYIHVLERVMKDDQPYLDDQLTLTQLAERIEIPSYQLSQVINEGLNRSFYDYINEFRVDEVKQKMKDPAFSHLSLLGIAMESGFGSKSSFNKAFKKFTGMSPTGFQYRNK